MVSSKATTVKEYLAGLPADRRDVIQAIRDVILKNKDKDIEEGMQYGMIGYYVPHSIYPPGYHVNPELPLGYIALAAQKNYYSLYLAGLYCGCGLDGKDRTPDAKWFIAEWAKTGKKLDMGKSCVRFKKLDDLPLDVIGKMVSRISVKKYIAMYEKALQTVAARKKK
jgi:uncharacterized protein YdhG (YjbR/CyaY superfamily)